jgi:hypothetical protein
VSELVAFDRYMGKFIDKWVSQGARKALFFLRSCAVLGRKGHASMRWDATKCKI